VGDFFTVGEEVEAARAHLGDEGGEVELIG